MSGDNLYGNQPLKFYSSCLTLTKISLMKFNDNKKYCVNTTKKTDPLDIEVKNNYSD